LDGLASRLIYAWHQLLRLAALAQSGGLSHYGKKQEEGETP